MSFGGAIGGMLTSIKNNARKRPSAFEKLDPYGNIGGKLHFKNKATPKDLEKVKLKIQQQNRKTVIIKIVISSVVAVLFYFILFYKP